MFIFNKNKNNIIILISNTLNKNVKTLLIKIYRTYWFCKLHFVKKYFYVFITL